MNSPEALAGAGGSPVAANENLFNGNLQSCLLQAGSLRGESFTIAPEALAGGRGCPGWGRVGNWKDFIERFMICSLTRLA